MQSRFLVSVAPGETRMKNIADWNHLFSCCRVDRKDQMETSNKGLKHTLETIRCLTFAIGNFAVIQLEKYEIANFCN